MTASPKEGQLEKRTYSYTPGGNESLLWYGILVLRWRWWLIGVPIAAALLVGALTMMRPREYTATAAFVPQSTAPRSEYGALASQFGLALQNQPSASPQFYADLIQSKEVLRVAIETDYAPEGSRFRGSLLRYYGLQSQPRTIGLLLAIQQLRANLSVRVGRTGIVYSDLTMRDGALAADVVRRMLDVVNDFNLRKRQGQAEAEREFVRAQLAASSADLRAAEESLADFYRRNRQFSQSVELRAEEKRLERQVSLRLQTYSSLVQRYDASRMDAVRNTPVITVLESPETLIEPKPRGTISRAVMAGVVALAITVFAILLREYFRRAREVRTEEYAEFEALRRQAMSGLRRFTRRAR